MTLILLKTWAERTMSPAPSAYTLRGLRVSGRISPAPIKIGRNWMVDECASILPAEAPDDVVSRILEGR